MGNEINKKLDRYFLRNTMSISLAEFFWGLGLPFVIESTFLQLFLKSLNASNLVIGLIPGFFFIGISVFALISGYFTTRLRYKRLAVVLLHLLSSSALFLFGLFFYFFSDASFVIPAFLLLYAIFSICVGMTLPVWYNYLVKIFSPERSVKGLAYMMIAQNIAKLLVSLWIVKLVDKYSFSKEFSAIVFTVVGISFLIGSFCFFISRELDTSKEFVAQRSGSESLINQSVNSGNIVLDFFNEITYTVKKIVKNRKLLYFLTHDLETFAVVSVLSFYAIYAKEYCSIDPAIVAGYFVAFVYVGGIAVNVVLGSLDFLNFKNKIIFSKAASITAMLLLIFFQNIGSFFLACFLLGSARAIRMMVFLPGIKKLNGEEDCTLVFSVVPLLTLPFSVSIPLLNGQFLDSFKSLGADSYRIMFVVMALLVFISFVVISKINFEEASKS